MTHSEKIRVAVLFGGCSAEHEVSLKSATNVIQYLDPTRFDVIPMGIDKQGHWFIGHEVFTKSLEFNKVWQHRAEDLTWFTPEWIGKDRNSEEFRSLPVKENRLSKKNGKLFDVIFPVVHGTQCEDGTLQGLLELAGVAYVGCGVLASAMGMDKDISKRLMREAGVPVAPYLVIKQEQWLNQPGHYIIKIEEQLSYPVFVKPANTGSSIGISKAKNKDQLNDAIHLAFQFDSKILIEKALEIRELEIAVLEPLITHQDPIVSVVGEIKPRHEFYSYDAKYIDEHGAELIIPADLPSDIIEKVRTLASKIFLTLECEGMARIDLFLDKKSQQIYFNEINTIPGFTQISMYPKLMAASGISYPDLLTHLIQLALNRHHRKSQLIRSYAG